jgi:hypothetical protein
VRFWDEPLTDAEVTDPPDALLPPVAWTFRGRRYRTLEVATTPGPMWKLDRVHD